MLSAGAALIGIVIGAVGACIVLFAWSRSRLRAARVEHDKLLADAGRDADAIRREAQVEAREQAVALRSEIESEAERAGRIVERRGASPKTARYLAGKGFSDDVVHAVVAHTRDETLG